MAPQAARRCGRLSPAPCVLHESVGERNQYVFAEIRAAHSGSFDCEVTDGLHISWTLGPMEMRVRGLKRAFAKAAGDPQLFTAGFGQAGEWRGAQRSLLLSISQAMIDSALHANRGRSAGDLDVTSIKHLLNLLRHDVAEGSPAGRVLRETIITQIIDRIFPSRDRDSLNLKEAARISGRARDIIEARITRSLGLAEIARCAGVSTRHLCRAFRLSLDASPHEYILKRRVELAGEHIRKGGTSFAGIADAAGFSSQAHMSTTFRKMLGETPSQFRNRTREWGRGSQAAGSNL